MTRTLLALGVAAAVAVGAPAGAAAAKLQISTTCFTAAGPDGKPYTIYGQRFAAGTPKASTPAIVLVHGVASSTRTWDLTPGWSVARRLADAGYVVIGYDRLGYRYSRYTGAGGGNALSVGAQQAVLHNMIGEIHRGTYKVASATSTCSPHAKQTRTRYPSKRVVIIGHSAGGFVVSSYPGRYHDVVGMVQANSPSGISSTNPAGNAAVVSATGPVAHGAMDDTYGFVGDGWNDGRVPRLPASYIASFSGRAACEEFNLWRPGAVKDVATPLCNPANIVPTPAGEGNSLVNQALKVNPGLIKQTGSIPVLLADADHDAVMPSNANQLEFSGWKENCGCHVSQFILKNTAHAFMAHSSLPQWIHNVVNWLRRNNIKAPLPRV